MLTSEHLRLCLTYNKEDGVFTWLRRSDKSKEWNTRYAHTKAGYLNHTGYILISVDGRQYRAHRLAWLYVTGRWPKLDLDHRDRCKTHNAWSNLREATTSQNIANAIFRPDKLKGAFYHKQTGRWASGIRHQGQRRFLGIFKTEQEAHAAYCEAAVRYHGEFARTA